MTHHLVTFVFACAALASLRACQCNLRHWRQHRRRPLILAPADELPVEAEWPLPDYRWPRPGAQAPEPLDPKLCAVYARLCRERAIIWRGIGQASIVVGGAWLGLQLPDLTHYFVAEASRPRTSIPVGNLGLLGQRGAVRRGRAGDRGPRAYLRPVRHGSDRVQARSRTPPRRHDAPNFTSRARHPHLGLVDPLTHPVLALDHRCPVILSSPRPLRVSALTHGPGSSRLASMASQ